MKKEWKEEQTEEVKLRKAAYIYTFVYETSMKMAQKRQFTKKDRPREERKKTNEQTG